MTSTINRAASRAGTITIGEAISRLMPDGVPFRFTAYDGSVAGPADCPIHLHLRNERGLSYLITAPGDLGLARAYVSGDLDLEGVHPGDPYEGMALLQRESGFKIPPPAEAFQIIRGLGWSHLKPPPPPPQEALPRWRRLLEGFRHSKGRDAEATLEEAQEFKYDLVARKLGLQPGMRLLDVGSGWGGMVRHAAKHYGVRVVGVTLSREQAAWAQDAIKADGLDDVAEVRHGDYRDIPDAGFDAVSSIGLTEHIGKQNLPPYFSFLFGKLKPGGRLLNHCITRPDNTEPAIRMRGFINRYVFPDGELEGPGYLISLMHDTGFEVRHEENLREHYALTLKGWCANLAANWDECVREVGEGTAKVWGLYMAGSRLSFERNEIQLHQVLAVKPDPDGNAHFPLRPTWLS